MAVRETIQDLEDMLRACGFRMTGTPIRAIMYGKNGRAPICWDEIATEEIVKNVLGSRASSVLDSSVRLRFGTIGEFRIVWRWKDFLPQFSHVHDCLSLSALDGDTHYHPLNVASYPLIRSA
ncbi:hypothetical protein Tco_1216203 [Tanacetum coccineum]